MTIPNRRDVLRLSTLAVASAVSATRVLGANDRIRAGMIGLGRRAMKLQSFLATRKDVEVTAICDVWDQRTREFQASVPQARPYRDQRKLLESSDVDVVFIATPDHWHAPIVVDAASAGKDVYVEKPLTLRIPKGRRSYGRCA